MWTRNIGVQGRFKKKSSKSRGQISNSHQIIEKAREFQKNIYFCFIDYTKTFDCIDHGKLWEILRDGNIRPSYLPPEKPVYMSKTTVRIIPGTKDGFTFGQGVCWGYILSPCKFYTYAEYTMWNTELNESQAGIKIARRNINKLRYADNTILMVENEEELKNLLMRVIEEREKAGIKLNIQKTKIMASCSITSWQIEGEKMETVEDFAFLGSKITVNSDCSHKIKTLLPWKESYDNPRQCIKRQSHHFANINSYSQIYGFPSSHVWMWVLNCKAGWGLKRKCLQIIVLEKTLENPLNNEVKSVNPKEINAEYSLERLMLKLKLWTRDEKMTQWRRF